MIRKTKTLGVAAIVAAGLMQNSAANAKAPPQPPLVLRPSSTWLVDYGDDKCRLARMFGTGDAETMFMVERYSPSDDLFTAIGGKPLADIDAAQAHLAFGPDGFVTKYPPSPGKLGERPALTATMALYPWPDSDKDDEDETGPADLFEQVITPEQEARVTWFEVTAKGRQTVRLELGSMAKPMAALRTCTQELVHHWGIDVDAHRTLSRRATPKGNVGNWVTWHDYPTDLLNKGEQGLVQFRVVVAADGKATQCLVQESTRPLGFDKAVCAALMRRAKFEPALDKDGKPIVSFWRSSVRFQMP